MEKSFSKLSTMFVPSTATPPGSRLGALIQATLPQAPTKPEAPYALATRQTMAVRQFLAGTPISAVVIPMTYWGKTYVLTSATATSYTADPSQTNAPATGVRFILYAVDPLTDQVVSPLVATGYVDLIDESSGSTNKIEVKVVDGQTTFVDYTISGTETVSAASLTLAGFITDGVTTVNFNITYSADKTTQNFTEQSTITVPVKNFSFTFNLTAANAVSGTVTTTTITFDFNLTVGSDNVTAHGTVTDTFDSSNSMSTSNGSIPIKVNGGLVATINITTNGTTITGPNGGTLNPDQEGAVLELFVSGEAVEFWILLLFIPFAVV